MQSVSSSRIQVRVLPKYHVDELDGEKFDVIVSLKTFHHVPNPLETITLLVLFTEPLFDIEILSQAPGSFNHRRLEIRCV